MDIEEQYDKIYRYCYFRLYDKQIAQDITQETFLRFYRQDLAVDSNRMLPYLYTIAKNLCTDEFRRKPLESLDCEKNFSEEAAYNPSEQWITDFALKAAIQKLPNQDQELLFLRYVNEVPVASICKITGLSRFAVYRRLSKALKWLKEELT